MKEILYVVASIVGAITLAQWGSQSFWERQTQRYWAAQAEVHAEFQREWVKKHGVRPENVLPSLPIAQLKREAIRDPFEAYYAK